MRTASGGTGRSEPGRNGASAAAGADGVARATGTAGSAFPGGPGEGDGLAGRGLVVVGAGGFARETAQAVRDVNAADEAAGRPARWRLLGYLDDDPALRGREVEGAPVLGGSELLGGLPADVKVLLCVGNPRDYAARARVARRLRLPGERYATVVHPSAAVSRSSVVGPGSVVLAHCVLTASVRVGAHVAVMPHVVLTHDDVVEDFATVASGVRLGGGARLARGAYAGAGALVREYVTVGAWSQVGMGSAVLGDVPPGEVWAGSPARRLRPAGEPALAELALGAHGEESRQRPAPPRLSGTGGRRADAAYGDAGRPGQASGRPVDTGGRPANAPHHRGAAAPRTAPAAEQTAIGTGALPGAGGGRADG